MRLTAIDAERALLNAAIQSVEAVDERFGERLEVASEWKALSERIQGGQSQTSKPNTAKRFEEVRAIGLTHYGGQSVWRRNDVHRLHYSSLSATTESTLVARSAGI